MYTTQSKMISRAIWVEKKHVWKINLQKNGVRKSFYSSVPGDKGRKICAQNATSWLSGACPFSVSERTTVDTVFERYLQDKALETTNIYTIRNRYNNHIKPIIGKVPVMLLTKQDLKRVIYTAYRKHNLSQKSLKNIRGDLSGFCNYLDCADIRNDLRTSNIKIPSNAKKGQKQALDVSSLNILFTESQVPYQDLKQKHAKYQHIWDKKQRYKWDRQPITNEQIALIHKLAPDYKIDTHKMTRGDASRAIQLLTYKPEEWTPQTTPSEVQDDAKKSP